MPTDSRAHGEKLDALLANPKLPAADRPQVLEAQRRYRQWREGLRLLTGAGDALLSEMLRITNEYKRFVEVDLIFDSREDFLYRQKGQLKLDNTILEEFLPLLFDQRLVPGLRHIEGLFTGPNQCFAGLYMGPVRAQLNDGGIFIKTKNQDFTVGKSVHMKASSSPSFPAASTFSQTLNVAYFAAEIKTNLDKTMFQEAAATARELKTNVREAVYVLLCEWLDMPPIDPRMTDIDDVIVLRRAKRLNSNVRANFSTSAGRQAARIAFVNHVEGHPLHERPFKRLLHKMNEAFPDQFNISEDAVLDRGYF